MDLLRKHFPAWGEIISVLGIAVFIGFSWTIFGFLNKIPSFILYFTPGEIANIFAYLMAFALLESLIVTGVLVIISAILPSGWLKEGFALKGFVIILVASVTAIFFQKSLDDSFPPTWLLLASSILPLVVMVSLIRFVRSQPKLQNILLNIQDRILIMLIIYVPIGVFSLMVVMYRNLV